jgi:hypothetical protein
MGCHSFSTVGNGICSPDRSSPVGTRGSRAAAKVTDPKEGGGPGRGSGGARGGGRSTPAGPWHTNMAPAVNRQAGPWYWGTWPPAGSAGGPSSAGGVQLGWATPGVALGRRGTAGGRGGVRAARSPRHPQRPGDAVQLGRALRRPGAYTVAKVKDADGGRRSVRLNRPHPETGAPSLTQDQIAHWPHSLAVKLGPLSACS